MHVGNINKTQVRIALDSSRHLSTIHFILFYSFEPRRNKCFRKHNKHFPQIPVRFGDSISKYLGCACEVVFVREFWKFVIRKGRHICDSNSEVRHTLV